MLHWQEKPSTWSWLRYLWLVLKSNRPNTMLFSHPQTRRRMLLSLTVETRARSGPSQLPGPLPKFSLGDKDFPSTGKVIDWLIVFRIDPRHCTGQTSTLHWSCYLSPFWGQWIDPVFTRFDDPLANGPLGFNCPLLTKENLSCCFVLLWRLMGRLRDLQIVS